jgi:putative NIF3 family GTP cyclohydrolase 1 type 2
MTGDELFDLIRIQLGPQAHGHRGVDAPSRRDVAIPGGSYRPPGMLVDGFRAGDADMAVTGVVVSARASTAVLHRARELGANIVISRQAFLGDSRDRPVAKPEPALADKLSFIAANGLAVLRLQDPRTGPIGQKITAALASAMGLKMAGLQLNPADGLVFNTPAQSVLACIRRLRKALPSAALRLVGDPEMVVRGLALATETSRPNALAPLLARPDVNLVIAGEVHETETAAWVQDAIALKMPKALLLIGSITMEELPARALADHLKTVLSVPVHFLEEANQPFSL